MQHSPNRQPGLASEHREPTKAGADEVSVYAAKTTTGFHVASLQHGCDANHFRSTITATTDKLATTAIQPNGLKHGQFVKALPDKVQRLSHGLILSPVVFSLDIVAERLSLDAAA